MKDTDSDRIGNTEPSDSYRIGAVAQLTGLSTDTIRAWERRYGLVEPTRTETGLRVYSLEDVHRLRLVKELRDQGESVAAVSGLSLEELEARVTTAQEFASRDDAPAGPLPVALLDPVIAMQLRERGHEGLSLDVSGTFESLAALVESLDENLARPRITIARLPQLGQDPLDSLQRILASSGSAGVIVVYNFAPGKLVRKMRALGAITVQAPIELAELGRLAHEAAGVQRAPSSLTLPAEPTPEGSLSNPKPLFTEAQLGRLREIESALDCECPHHLSAIVLGLLAFERYSSKCEELDPRDAAVHAALHRQTGEARVIMERALKALCEHERIEL